jgi:hypothetical protein
MDWHRLSETSVHCQCSAVSLVSLACRVHRMRSGCRFPFRTRVSGSITSGEGDGIGRSAELLQGVSQGWWWARLPPRGSAIPIRALTGLCCCAAAHPAGARRRGLSVWIRQFRGSATHWSSAGQSACLRKVRAAPGVVNAPPFVRGRGLTSLWGPADSGLTVGAVGWRSPTRLARL